MAIGTAMRLPLATLAGAVIGVVCALGIGWGWHYLNPGHSDLHERLHAVVPLDNSEKDILQAKEQLFATRRGEIEARLRIANRQLADAIAADPRWSPQVEAASREVERAAGDLQRITLEHVFEMRAGLKPDHRAAYDKALLDALRNDSP
ncbi:MULTISPECIES: periplasmic heavy metal sensor [Gammaproteobacteria]|jgi:uncharacterized protein YicC (UPF0701 family)|uniref:Signaling pathway modulator ZraP n=2 Tax=Stenotrophomonas TaxID=40323 RepID=A0AAJ2WJ81_STEMA|nr:MULTISPECIES: periplasmic heavy metal sensor [Gammaproteobacteria]EKU9957790.1 periplasmic heavy metal sensor [Stenotrophomonas maltophilia]EKU9974851.1 periplasmic heavy metal sensor [Stenotrophomonas maltophilia]EKU9983575.1 periplasmic heavy metal sensor [Stenotrophomonas maltophilia]MBA0361996.1 periplasmic heavy metal sensor [Stenotrophomonas maltophilia]MBA0430234.1 periplasmic heavy metal sensor [Stenotrophomonas maltophilia]